MKKKVYGLIGIAAVAAVGGTFAYYSASQTFTNPFDTTNFGTSTTERFNPEDAKEWKPGTEVDKDVSAANTGEGPVWVRVKFDEQWTRKDEDGNDTLFGIWNSGEEGFFPASTEYAGRTDKTLEKVNVSFDDDGNTITENWTYHQMGIGDGKEAQRKAGETDGEITKVTIGEGEETKEILKDSGSVVYKNLLNFTTTAPTAPEATWYYNPADGYFYYAQELAGKTDTTPGGTTGKLLDSVTLCGNADMGYFNQIDKWLILDEEPTNEPNYIEDSTGWIDNTEFEKKTEADKKDKYIYHYKADELDSTKQGYANAGYTLNITVEYVQATEEGETSLPIDSTWWYPGKQSAGTNPDEGGNEEPTP